MLVVVLGVLHRVLRVLRVLDALELDPSFNKLSFTFGLLVSYFLSRFLV